MADHRTADINYAAYLKVAGVQFLGTESQGRRVIFKFGDSPNIEELKLQYFNRQARVVALDFVDEVKALRNLSFAD